MGAITGLAVLLIALLSFPWFLVYFRWVLN
jgi:hypothetical protein